MRLVCAIGLAALVAACSSDECVTPPPSTCDALYEPTWSNVYAETISKRCALAGGACHASEGGRGDLALDGEAKALAEIQARVTPGDPGCSLLFVRLEGGGGGTMPPGSGLSEPERCAISRWIAAGAVAD